MVMTRERGLGSRLALAGLSLLASLALAEFVARIWLTRLADDEAFRSYASVAQLEERLGRHGQRLSRWAPHRYVGWIPSPGFRRGPNHHDPLGYRGGPIPQPKPAGEYRIVCLGGSTTYSDRVQDPKQSYPARLEHALHERGYPQVRVVNAGASGYSTYETLINFELRVLDLAPDMVIVYHAVNDLSTRMVWPASAYRGDNSGHVQAPGGLRHDTPLLERSTLARILLVRLGHARSQLGLFRNYMRAPPSDRAWAFMGQKEKGTYPSGPFLEADAMELLERNPPRYFERNLVNLVLIARAWSTQAVLLTFVHDDRAEDPALNSPEVRRGIAEHNEVIREIGRRLDVPVYDLASDFPSQPRLFVGAVHFTAAGNQLRGNLIADFLVREGLLPRGQEAR